MTHSTSLIAVAFVFGFVLAAFALWPLRRRAHRSDRTPKHALGARRTAKPNADLGTETAPRSSDKLTDTSHPDVETSATETKTGATAIHPQDSEPPEAKEGQRSDKTDIPTLPSGLFDQRYRSKFDRTRRRLERLRDQVEQEHTDALTERADQAVNGSKRNT